MKPGKFNIIRGFCLLVVTLSLFTSCMNKDDDYAPSQYFTVTVNTIGVSFITPTSAWSGGVITDTGRYTITSKGICWSTSDNPAISNNTLSYGGGSGGFISKLTGLRPGIEYYVRAFATSDIGISYGNEIRFSTPFVEPVSFNQNLTYGIVTDTENNTYRTIDIGSKTWMAENLKTSVFNDGSPITFVASTPEWGNSLIPAHCYYDFNRAVYRDTYGALYNWAAVSTGKLCPVGWHIPGDDEWRELINHYGGDSEAGATLKETGTGHWLDPNPDASNESGFTSLPGAMLRGNPVDFLHLGESGYWWTNTMYSSDYVYGYLIINSEKRIVRTSQYISNGMSVRCVKN